MIFLPMIFPVGTGGSVASKPKTNGPLILGVIAAFVLVACEVIGYAVAGAIGLLAAPAFIVYVAWSFAWGWAAVQCLSHSIAARGPMAGAFVTGGLLSAGIALGSFVAVFTIIIRLTLR